MFMRLLSGVHLTTALWYAEQIGTAGHDMHSDFNGAQRGSLGPTLAIHLEHEDILGGPCSDLMLFVGRRTT